MPCNHADSSCYRHGPGITSSSDRYSGLHVGFVCAHPAAREAGYMEVSSYGEGLAYRGGGRVVGGYVVVVTDHLTSHPHILIYRFKLTHLFLRHFDAVLLDQHRLRRPMQPAAGPTVDRTRMKRISRNPKPPSIRSIAFPDRT
jgi:hypothetical protein